MQFDVVIVGAGPAGLSFARSLAGTGLSVAIVEKLPESDLANPPFDGREIALTHLSAELLRGLDAWSRIPAEEISPLREARVMNGASSYAMRFNTARRSEQELGYLVANHLIRRAVYEAAAGQPHLTLLAGVSVARVDTDANGARVRLADGRELAARLVVAADTRFSETRRRQGIPASMHDFGKVMMVCRVAHDEPHEHIATEWFDYGQTIAMLPLNGNVSSAVITLPGHEIDQLMAMDPAAFGAEITERYRNRLGGMRLVSTRHAYPLVAVYAERFAANRFALIGDAAVGMHPVTAHGFNFGLRGQHTLAEEIKAAASRGRDIADPALLRRYQSAHRRATRLMYLGTNATAMLYTDDRLPARMVRDAALRIGNRLPPVRWAVQARLMEAGGLPRPRLPPRT
jgi:ubiquinone biosynthesis UbiH/UbiF/VisC/COQ6 family hydroxylase